MKLKQFVIEVFISCSYKFHKIHRKTPGPETLFLKKQSLAQVFSCEFCEIYKNTFFTEHLRTAASLFTAPNLNHFKQEAAYQYRVFCGLNMIFAAMKRLARNQVIFLSVF